jgi:pyruvate dehydrogenase (quinone)
MSKSVGQVLVDTLIGAGVRRIYGVPGDSLNAITDAIRKTDGLTWSHVRHEETAAFAASAEAHLTGRLAVCAGSCGPGNLHLINGLYEAHRSRVPVLAIAAQIPSGEVGSSYFQETRPEALFRECSHYCETIAHPAQMPRVLEIAMQTAIARRGVAVIVVPGDIAGAAAVVTEPRVTITYPDPTVVPSEAELAKLAAILNGAAKVTILGGAGCAGAHAELVAVAGKLQAPVVHALRGKEHIEYDNPYDVGLTGLLGFSSGYYAMTSADVLLMLGTDFPYQDFYPKHGTTIVQVDIRGEQLGRRARLDLGVVGDVRQTLAALLPRLVQKADATHIDKSVAHYRSVRKDLDGLANDEAVGGRSHPQYLARTLDEVAADDAVFTCDVGTPTLWAARYLRMNGRRRLIGSFNHGSMANALTQAIGAQSAAPGRQVVAMCGDGGLAMLLGDLLTLRQMDLPVKVVVFRNDTLSFVELEMKSAGIIEFGTDLTNPDFAKIAEASGLLGLRADVPADVRPALQRALSHPGPALVEVMVNRQELSIPPTVTLAQAKGFSLYMIRAILNGRGDEVLDLATSKNLITESIAVGKAMLR